ncbi:hypothetical protein DICVIV_09447 [Dictyocaulus viviparus]|uniref:Uncharacterized protein n=1 Tax=Dictyocaulus viviparus TaxID=29172 RepID=A0A0D8XQ67_DICVI|nr:hypothetical protein DICVIV_09447 [Dictyocaulus viviparus]
MVFNDSKMPSADVLRGSIQPLGINTSMNIQRNETIIFFALETGDKEILVERVPIDRPLFVNTSMTAQNRIDLYRRLGDPPQDNEDESDRIRSTYSSNYQIAIKMLIKHPNTFVKTKVEEEYKKKKRKAMMTQENVNEKDQLERKLIK